MARRYFRQRRAIMPARGNRHAAEQLDRAVMKPYACAMTQCAAVAEHVNDAVKTAGRLEGGVDRALVVISYINVTVVQVAASYTGQALRQVLAAGRTHAYATR